MKEVKLLLYVGLVLNASATVVNIWSFMPNIRVAFVTTMTFIMSLVMLKLKL